MPKILKFPRSSYDQQLQNPPYDPELGYVYPEGEQGTILLTVGHSLGTSHAIWLKNALSAKTSYFGNSYGGKWGGFRQGSINEVLPNNGNISDPRGPAFKALILQFDQVPGTTAGQQPRLCERISMYLTGLNLVEGGNPGSRFDWVQPETDVGGNMNQARVDALLAGTTASYDPYYSHGPGPWDCVIMYGNQQTNQIGLDLINHFMDEKVPIITIPTGFLQNFHETNYWNNFTTDYRITEYGTAWGSLGGWPGYHQVTSDTISEAGSSFFSGFSVDDHIHHGLNGTPALSSYAHPMVLRSASSMSGSGIYGTISTSSSTVNNLNWAVYDDGMKRVDVQAGDYYSFAWATTEGLSWVGQGEYVFNENAAYYSGGMKMLFNAVKWCAGKLPNPTSHQTF